MTARDPEVIINAVERVLCNHRPAILPHLICTEPKGRENHRHDHDGWHYCIFNNEGYAWRWSEPG